MAQHGNLVSVISVECYELCFRIAACASPLFLWTCRFWLLYPALMVCGVLLLGFGHHLAKHLDDMGFTVFAGCLTDKGHGVKALKSYCSKRLHIVPVDVTKDSSVASAVKYVKLHIPKKGLWGVVNNAGINVRADVELTSIKLLHTGTSVNLYGAIRVIQSFLPLIRQSQGRIVIVTSVLGIYSWPGISCYSSSKHGLETLGDSLRLEMQKFNVKVSIVEPGNYGHSTAIDNSVQVKRNIAEVEELWASASDEVKKRYGRPYFQHIVPQTSDDSAFRCDLSPVVSAMTHALLSHRPKTRYLVGGCDEYLPYFDWRTVISWQVLPYGGME